MFTIDRANQWEFKPWYIIYTVQCYIFYPPWVNMSCMVCVLFSFKAIFYEKSSISYIDSNTYYAWFGCVTVRISDEKNSNFECSNKINIPVGESTSRWATGSWNVQLHNHNNLVLMVWSWRPVCIKLRLRRSIMDFSTVDIRSIRYQTDLSGLTPLG